MRNADYLIATPSFHGVCFCSNTRLWSFSKPLLMLNSLSVPTVSAPFYISVFVTCALTPDWEEIETAQNRRNKLSFALPPILAYRFDIRGASPGSGSGQLIGDGEIINSHKPETDYMKTETKRLLAPHESDSCAPPQKSICPLLDMSLLSTRARLVSMQITSHIHESTKRHRIR